MAAGKLIVLEGSEGAGKSTQVARLAAAMERAGRRRVVVREPGGTVLGESIRTLLLDSDHAMVPTAEALLFMASRAELVETVIRPALDRGDSVLADRFFLSTYAYQIGGRGLSEQAVRSANALATGGLTPDVTILLDVTAAAGLARASARGGPDRLEREGGDFHGRVERAFARFRDPAWQREHPECGPVVRVDGAGSVEDVGRRVAVELARLWPESFSPLLAFAG